MQAFLAVSTQWRMAPRADGGVRLIGLDYAGARAGLEMAGVRIAPDLWNELRLIEAGAVQAMNGG